MDLCAPRTEAGCCQFISVTTDSRRVISYGLMVSGDVFYAAGWAEANSETVADASEEVTSERRVGVAEQILVPGILRKEPVHPAGAAVTVVLRIYVFQGQEVHILAVAPIHNPSNLDLCETRGGKVTRLPRLGGGGDNTVYVYNTPAGNYKCSVLLLASSSQFYYPEHVLTWEGYGNRRVCSCVVCLSVCV